MESVTSSSSVSAPQEASHYDELFMQQSLLFSDNLKDLKNLRRQLYSAAEYFELAYSKDDQKQLVMDTLKEYATRALINTVDHLGSVAYKVNNFLDEKVGEVARIELRFSGIEQRARSCQEFIDYGGLSQQSLAIRTPKHHKRYILPETMNAVGQTKSESHICSPCAEGDLHQFKKAAQATTNETPSSSMRELLSRTKHSASPSSQSSSSPRTFSFARIASVKELDKQKVSPQPFPFRRSGSLVSRSPTLNSSNDKRRHSSQPRRSISLGACPPEREKTKQIDHYPGKSKRLVRALFSMRKSKKEGTLYEYLNEN